MRPARSVATAVVAAALSAACAPATTVILLPEPGGGRSAVSVVDSRGEVVLDQPYAAVRRTTLATERYQSSEDEVRSAFGPTLAAQPRREASFTVHFAEGRDAIDEPSLGVIDAALREAAGRPVADVLVVGHTDRVGTDAVNDALARQRAETVRAELVRRGLAPGSVQASGRGSREPVVPTPAGVAEPRNRRVDIIVR
jgi:OmpA-OmpF porin, OOP family